MHIFLDESGDLGFDFENKSPSKYFVITLLACSDKRSVDTFRSAVKKTLKNKINYNKKKKIDNELKANKAYYSSKNYFYKYVCANENWHLYSIVLNKQALLKNLDKKPDIKQLYNFMSRKIMEKVPFDNSLAKVELIVDRSKSTKEIKIFNEYLSNHLASYLPLNSQLIIDHIHSRNNACLQAVDLFAGAYSENMNTKT
ncbi:MAG: DUF3800 domain-containing protein [Gammaproteobacteria bacterium]|jgi:hypothetical protein